MIKDIIIIERRLFSSFGHERTQIVALNELAGNKKSIVLTCKGQNLKKIPFKNKMYAELPEYDFKNEGKETLNYIKKNGNAFASFLKRNKLNSKYKSLFLGSIFDKIKPIIFSGDIIVIVIIKFMYGIFV